MSDRRARIEAIFLNHATRPGSAERVRPLAGRLLTNATMNTALTANRMRMGGTKKALSELRAVAAAAANLSERILALHAEAYQAVTANFHAGHPLKMAYSAKGLAEAAGVAKQQIEAGPFVGRPPAADGKRKIREREVALECAGVYFELTGKPATTSTIENKDSKNGGFIVRRDKGFVKFLADVYKAMGFERVSAIAQAKAVCGRIDAYYEVAIRELPDGRKVARKVRRAGSEPKKLSVRNER